MSCGMGKELLQQIPTAKVQMSLHICAVSPEPMLLTRISGRTRWNYSQRITHVASLRRWTCTLKNWLYRKSEEPFSCNAAYTCISKCHFLAWKSVSVYNRTLCWMFPFLLSHNFSVILCNIHHTCSAKLPGLLISPQKHVVGYKSKVPSKDVSMSTHNIIMFSWRNEKKKKKKMCPKYINAPTFCSMLVRM